MNRLKLWKIVTPIMGVAAVGSIAGAVGYYFYKTAPEKWNNKLQEFREVHLGFDGNQMIGYLATGQYEDATYDATTSTWKADVDAKDDHLLYGGEMEYHKVVYVKNLNANAEGVANRVTKYELNFADREKSIIKTLAGKQGDQYQIVTKSEGITFRNPEIRKVVFQNIPDISLAAYQTNGAVDVKKIRNAINKMSDDKTLKLDGKPIEKDYDDEDIKPYSKDTGALFRLDYMSGDVSMGGVDGKVDTPTTSFVKTIDFDSVDTKTATAGTLVGKPVAAGQILKLDSKTHAPVMDYTGIKPKYIYDDKKVTLDITALDIMGGIDNFSLRIANPTNVITQDAAYMMPRAMADVSQDTQLIDKKISVNVGGQERYLGKLERYNNELLVSDLSNIYSGKQLDDAAIAALKAKVDAATKAAGTDATKLAAIQKSNDYITYMSAIERAHVGDLKITSWW